MRKSPFEDAPADADRSSMWRLEAIGILVVSEDFGFNYPAIEQFEHRIRKLDGRYEVAILIKEPGLDVSDDNYRL